MTRVDARFADVLRNEAEKVKTENGAPSYTSESIKDDLLRLFYEVSATHKQIIDAYKDSRSITKRWGLFQTDWRTRFVKAYKAGDEESQKLLLRLLGVVRDPRRGMGERAMFRGVLYDLFRDQCLDLRHLGEVVAEYGRWDDLVAIFAKVKIGKKFLAEIMNKQLQADMKAMARGESVSLLAKWLPKENASSKETKRVAKALMRYMKIRPKRYRKMLSALRGYLKVVERDMSAKRWEEIDYEIVPSLAMHKYREAFLRHDESRFSNYLDDVLTGKRKINAGVANPATLIANYEDDSAVAQWNALPKVELAKPILPIVDVSGSMMTPAGGGAQCIDVAMALGILLSEANTGPYKDIILPFSSTPSIIDLSGLDIREKVIKVSNAEWGNSTNIAAALRLILKLAIDAGMPKDSVLPDLVVFSDMEFDVCQSWAESVDCVLTETVFETLTTEYERAGFKLPKVIFWNLSSNGRTLLPIKENDLGIIELSGYSQHLFEMLTSNDFDPLTALLKFLAKDTWAKMEKLWSSKGIDKRK